MTNLKKTHNQKYFFLELRTKYMEFFVDFGLQERKKQVKDLGDDKYNNMPH